MISLEDKAVMKHLAQQGKSARALARELGMDRKTVKKYLQGGEPGYHRTEAYPSELEAYQSYVLDRLKRYPDMTADRIHRDLIPQGFTGSYRSVARLVQELRPQIQQEAFLRFETDPGEYAQMDWGEFGTVNHYGRKCKLYGFALVLCYSRMLYVEFTTDTTLVTLMRCHQHAFEYFGGLPQKIAYDNMKTVVQWHLVDSQSKLNEVHFNDAFMRFCNHYGFLPRACAPYSPHEKGKVENSIGYVRSSFFVGTEAEEVRDWNLKVTTWLDTVANVRVHGTTGEVPLERLKGEQSRLRPLPGTVYETAISEERKVHKDCTLSFQGNTYSVPHALVGRRVTLKADTTHVRVFADGKLHAVHDLCQYRGKRIIDQTHYEGIARPRQSSASHYVKLFEPWGSVGEAFVRGLIAARLSDPYSHLQKVATLSADYPTEAVVAVLQRSLHFQAFEYKTVKRLLQEGADSQSPRAGQGKLFPEGLGIFDLPPSSGTDLPDVASRSNRDGAIGGIPAGGGDHTVKVQCRYCPPQAEEVQQRPLSVYDVVTHAGLPAVSQEGFSSLPTTQPVAAGRCETDG